MTIQHITVFGATGMIGRKVTEALVQAGFTVTALVRNPEKAQKMLPAEVTLVKGDLDNKDSIAISLKEADAVYINISTTPTDKENAFNPEMQGLDNILEMVKTVPGIKRVAYLSSFLARNYSGNWWVMRAKKSSIERVKKSGIPYTIFYPSNFMDNFTNGMVQKNKIMIPKVKSAQQAWWISASDFGKQVANALRLDSSANREYAVQGAQPFMIQEAAAEYVKHHKKTQLTISSMPLGMMKFMVLFIPQLRFLSKLMEVMLNNPETFESQKTWDELGKPETTMKVFAEQV